MRISAKRVLAAGFVASATLLAGCGYGGYGYTGLSVGVSDGYYDGYGAPYGAPYYGYGGGWYNDFYYPGGGYYIYDRAGHRSRWNDSQRVYWESHRGQGRWQGGDRPAPAPGTTRGWYYGGGRHDRGASVAQGGQAVAQPATTPNDRGFRGGRGNDPQVARPSRANDAQPSRPPRGGGGEGRGDRGNGPPRGERGRSADEGRELPR